MGLCAAGVHSWTLKGCSNLGSSQWMAELLWHAQNLFQFTDPCRYSGGVRPNQPSVGLLFPAGPSEVVRGPSFVEEFPPLNPSFVNSLFQPNGANGQFHR